MEFNSKIFDHTCLKPFAKNEELKKLCSEAAKFNFKTVAINNAYIEYCKKELKGTEILIDAAVSFPLGQSTLETKVFETKDAIEKGAGEVDYVINIAQLKNKNYKYIEKEMSEIVEICRKKNITSKVIFENCYLTDDEKILLCEIANNIKPDFIKTSTGFGISGATFEDVKLMRKHAKDYIKIKAAGGIKTKKNVLKYLELGVSRIGCSSSVQIINE
ncbi:deoxyribose-phosphate aldolase [Oceanotoga sp. DSM 15011]|uniref:deoxyribose-phosphate aldolase n=1 Tax=Oceanotoga sp. DSM 15011 TaxID=2984951 RepID=UPI0021F42C47|nr:deoxyribose-phosphate aldolase [Oceanotoga sp. DSM 15011]UYP01368.1 deoxyribose-phosphate aldolase [Oceanotoga sp. DSM 15011]